MIRQIFATLGSIAALLSSGTPAKAATDVNGMVLLLNHYEGHSGVLVKLDQMMIAPQACGRGDLYIVPDSSPRAQFVQAMLLTAQSTQRRVYVTIDGCLDGLPKILAVRNGE